MKGKKGFPSGTVKKIEPVLVPEGAVAHLKENVGLFAGQNVPHLFVSLDILANFRECRMMLGKGMRQAVQAIVRVRCKSPMIEGFPILHFADLVLYAKGQAKIILCRSKKDDIIWARSCLPVYCDPAHGHGFLLTNAKLINGWYTTRLWNLTAWVDHRFSHLSADGVEELQREISESRTPKEEKSPWDF